VRYVEVDVPIEGFNDLAELADALESTATEVVASASGRSVVLRAVLSGKGAVHHDLVRSESVRELLHALRDGAPTAPFCWWDSLEDATSAPVDIDEIRRRGDFAADLLAIADETAADVSGRYELFSNLLDGAPNAVVEAAKSMLLDEDRLSHLLERARLLALDKVTGAES